MRTTRGVAAVVVVASVGCFSTTPFDHAHLRRVVSIQARYDAELRIAREDHASLVAELDKLRAFVVAIKPEPPHAPARRVAEREDLVACRRCQPDYADALLKTYFDADISWVMGQLFTSRDTDLESLMAFSHNRAILIFIEDQVRASARREAVIRHRLERARHRELQASARRRDLEIESGRAAHRARVKAAATAWSTADRSLPPLTPPAQLMPAPPAR